MPDQLRPIERLVLATNRHDLDALAACFAADYENETPAHPARSFRGRDQVRRIGSRFLHSYQTYTPT
jgi:ketosteroid isomerase-like protein